MSVRTKGANDPITWLGTITPSERDTLWTEQAECRFHDPELFFPEDYREYAEPTDRHNGVTGAWKRHLLEEALTICSYCPVQQECLRDALDLGDDYGIRAGMTGKDRAKYRKKTQKGQENHGHKASPANR